MCAEPARWARPVGFVVRQAYTVGHIEQTNRYGRVRVGRVFAAVQFHQLFYKHLQMRGVDCLSVDWFVVDDRLLAFHIHRELVGLQLVQHEAGKLENLHGA